MRRLYCFTIGLFLLTVGAEKEDFQGYRTEQTKGTLVRGDLLLRKENTIGHGTEAIPQQNPHQHTAVAVTAKFPGAVLFDTGPTPPHGTTQNIKASAVIASASGERFITRNGRQYLTSAAFESMMNGTLEPEVRLSADVLKASLGPHTLRDNRNQRNTDSITLTSADGGPGVPILSASHPRVIDNLAALSDDNDDKRPQGEDEKGISNLGRMDEYLSGAMQSIFQGDSTEDSVRGNTGTNLCLTCQKDRRGASTEKSVAQPELSPDGSSDSLSTEGLALDFNQFTTSLPSLHSRSFGKQEDILNKEISRQSITKRSSFSVGGQSIHSLTFPSLSFNTTVNLSILNDSQIRYLLSTAAFQTQSHAEISPVTQKDTRKESKKTFSSETSVTRKPISAITVLYGSSKALQTLRKPLRNAEMFGKTVSTGDPQSKEIDDKNAFQILSTILDFSGGSVIKTPAITDAPASCRTSVLLQGNDHNSALIDARGAATLFSLSRPTAARSSHALTGRADSSVSAPQTKATSQTKAHILTLLLKDSKIASIPTKRQLADSQDSQTFSTANSIVKQSFVDPLGSVMKHPQIPTFATRNVVAVKLLLSEARQDFDEDVSTLTPTTQTSKSFSERPTTGRLLGRESQITQERMLDVSNDYHVATRQSFGIYSGDVISDAPRVRNPKPGDKNMEVLTVDVEDEGEEQGRQNKEITHAKEIPKLQQKEQNKEDEKLGNRSEELFISGKMENGKVQNIITSGEEISQNTDLEDKEEECEAHREEGGGTTGEEDVALRQDKDLRQEGVRGEEGADAEGVTKIKTHTLTEDVAEKQSEALKEGAEETADEKGFQHNREIGREGTTNSPTGRNTNSEKFNRDKGHPVTSLSSCHCLIKQLETTEHGGVHLGGKIAQIVEMKNKPFSYKVTSNHRALHSTLRSQSPKLSSMTSSPSEPYTQIKPHPSTHRAIPTNHGSTSPLTKESAQIKVVNASFSVPSTPKTLPKLSQTFGVSTSEFNDALKPTFSQDESAPRVPNSISNMLSVTTPRLAITAGFLRAQPHFKANSSTLSASIIYSVLDEREKFSTSGLEANSLLETANEGEQAERITPATIFESSVKGPLTSNMIEGVNGSTSVTPALLSLMQNDSSSKPPTDAAFDSIGQLQPHQGQSSPQVTQSSFDMSSGQPCSFKLSKQTTDSDALHAPVSDNEQRSVQASMSSMSPKARNNQFPLSGTSPPLNLVLFGSDSLPRTYSLTELTRSASERDAEYANSGGGRGESSFGSADETNQTEEYDSKQTMVTLAVKYSDVATKQMAGSRNEKDGYPFTTQPIGRRKHHASNTDEFNSLSIKQTEELAVKTTNENNHNDLFSVEGEHEANNPVKAALQNNHPSQLGGYNETSAKPFTIAIQTTRKIERAVNEDFVPLSKDFATPVRDTNDRTDSGADRRPEIPIIQANDVTNSAISDIQRPAERTIEKQHDPSTPQDTFTATHIHFRSDLKIPIISRQQIAGRIMTVTPKFQITTTKTNDSVSLTPADSINAPISSLKAHESALTANEQVVTEQSSHAERSVPSSNHIKSITLTSGKLIPAVNRKYTIEMRNEEQPEREISVQDIKQSQHALSGIIAMTSPINDPLQDVQTRLFNRATPTAVKRVEYSSFKDIKTTMTTESAFEAKRPPHERTPTAHAPDREDQPAKTSITKMIVGPSTDFGPTWILPTEIIHETGCRTIGCAKSSQTSDETTRASETNHPAREKMYKTHAGHTRRDRVNASHTPGTGPGNGSCSTGCPVPGNVTPHATNPVHAAASKSGRASVDEAMTQNANSMIHETSTWRALVETETRQGILELDNVENATQRLSHRETSAATEVALSEPEATIVKATEQTLPNEMTTKTILNRAAKAEISEVQNATRSAHSLVALQQSGRRLLLPEPASEAELLRLKHRRRSSTHLYLSGVTEVSDELCGSGNYTAEMSLSLGRDVEPGDAVPARGNLRVVINLKTNNSRLNLEVTSCCLSPTSQPDLTDSTCCLFSRLAAEPAGITLLPTALPTSASFTISLFQMINYSVAYLHCDLSVCLRNRSDCERQCLQQRSAFPPEGPEAFVTNLRNRISFGPMLKEVNNSSFPEEIDPSELDLVLVIVSLVVGSSVVTVTLLLVWLAYRRRAIWLLQSAAPPPVCCGCLRPGGDLILP